MQRTFPYGSLGQIWSIAAWCAAGLMLLGCGDEEASGGPGADNVITQTGTASVDGASLYYEMRGTGEAVLLLHGFTLDTRMWDSQFARLSQTHRVVRFDMRGHGRSSGTGPVNGAPAMFSQAGDVLGLMDALQIDQAHIVGLSMGGYVAYEFALDHPERVLSLATVDASWRYDAAKTSDFQTRVVGYITTAATDLEAGLRGWMADALFAPANADPAVKAALEQIVLEGHLAQGAEAFFANPLSATTPSPMAETRLAELAMPTLVIVGDLDDPEFVAHSDAIAAAVSGAQKIVIAGSGHMSTMEKPDEVNRALAAFLVN